MNFYKIFKQIDELLFNFYKIYCNFRKSNLSPFKNYYWQIKFEKIDKVLHTFIKNK